MKFLSVTTRNGLSFRARKPLGGFVLVIFEVVLSSGLINYMYHNVSEYNPYNSAPRHIMNIYIYADAYIYSVISSVKAWTLANANCLQPECIYPSIIGVPVYICLLMFIIRQACRLMLLNSYQLQRIWSLCWSYVHPCGALGRYVGAIFEPC